MPSALEADGYLVDASADAFGDIRRARPDIVILDLFIRGETSGWQQLDILTMDPATRGIPFILCLAAIASLEHARPKIAALDVRVLEKPFELSELEATVEEHRVRLLRDREHRVVQRGIRCRVVGSP